MKALLICPDERPHVRFLGQPKPLALLPIFGKALVVYWIEHLVTLGAKEIRIIAADRPDQIRSLVGDGSRWGLQIEVSPELRELTPAEARAKYRQGDRSPWLATPADISLMSHFPGCPEHPLFNAYGNWFNALRALMPRIAPANQLGAREVKPGVWVGLRARVSPSAELRAPCWIGANTIVGPHSVVGPMAILEDRVMVEPAVEITDSCIGPETFVGELTEVRDSLANGNTLINWRTTSCVRVPDSFLMCSLGERNPRLRPSNWVGRASAFVILLATLPIAIVPFLRAKIRNRPSLVSFIAVRPQMTDTPSPTETMVYYELADCTGWLRFWPQMWNIVKGDFAWVGNRPLSPGEVEALSNDFERLWLAAPIGLISLADAEGATGAFSDETRACASFYAVQANWRLDMSIIARTVLATTKKSLAALFL